MSRAVVTGGAGFLGSHLCERLISEGWEVVCVDSLLTGKPKNMADLRSHANFAFVEKDVADGFSVDGPVDAVLHFASPASPKDYYEYPIETLRIGSLGTMACLELALAKGAELMLASSSEVYGDPLIHPQPEHYWGNVNPIGPRSVYDEAKRFSEAVTAAYGRARGLNTKIIRIFNTYGPRMQRRDGRAVPAFIDQALRNEPLTVHGDGSQTRSLCYVDDLIEGIFRVLTGDCRGPMNLGNPEEVKILELARAICDGVGSKSEIMFVDRPADDPEMRCPDISMARQVLSWEPRIRLSEGLDKTIEWARANWS